jgi:hypothetical protein
VVYGAYGGGGTNSSTTAGGAGGYSLKVIDVTAISSLSGTIGSGGNVIVPPLSAAQVTLLWSGSDYEKSIII